MKRGIIIIIVLIIAAALIWFVAFKGEELFVDTDKNGNLLSCSADADCVPADCCHASSCVNDVEKPDCSGMFCTMECAPGTMDCGQGHCGCVDNKCEVVNNR